MNLVSKNYVFGDLNFKGREEKNQGELPHWGFRVLLSARGKHEKYRNFDFKKKNKSYSKSIQ